MASNNHAPRDLVDLSLRLHELAIHTGDLKHSCLGCGHEHNCGVHGCAVLLAAEDAVVKLKAYVRKLVLRGGWMTMAEAKEAVHRLPATDVAPVVHCKDCAHRTEMGNCGHPRHHGILPSAYPYDFCSYGARMDGGADNETD